MSALEAAEEAIEQAQQRWPDADIAIAELGLVAEALGVATDVDGRDGDIPVFLRGSVLLAARAATSTPTATISPMYTSEMVVTESMITRAIDKGVGGDLDGLGDGFTEEFLRPAVRGVLEDILGIGPAAPGGADRG